MNSGAALDAIVDTIGDFFAEHEVASLRLPSGWFGRPYDNWHQLTQVSTDGRRLRVRLDQVQVLDLDASDVSVEGRALRVAIWGGAWNWTSYGGTDEHHEVLGYGAVEFHAPPHQ